MALVTVLLVAGLSISTCDVETGIYARDDALEMALISSSAQNAVSADADTEKYDAGGGIESATLIIEAPCMLPVGETLTAKAVLKNAPEDISCTVRWYMDDVLLLSRNMTTGSPPPEFNYAFAYSPEAPASISLRAEVTYAPPLGEEQIFSDEKIIEIENYDFGYWFDSSLEQVTNKVTSEYAGDYTTEFALANDLSDFEKEVWINAGDFKSRTDYIVWVNIAYQRVNIFEREAAKDGEITDDAGADRRWKLIRTCLVSTGAPRTPTPQGTFYVNGKQEDGWHLTSYVVRPVVNFSAGVNYAFHSRLYYPDSDELYDDTIGYPVSRGCIRMLDEDIEFIFANIPAYTTVVVN